MLGYIFCAVLALAPALQAVFDLQLQLAFQYAVLLGCLAWAFLKASGEGLPEGLLPGRAWPLPVVCALTLLSLALSPLRGWIFNEWGNFAAGLLLLAFTPYLTEEEGRRCRAAFAWGAWLVFGVSLLQAFVLKNFASAPPLTNLNALALYAVMALPLALEDRRWALAGAMVILTIWTQSLGAVLALLAAVGFYAAPRFRAAGRWGGPLLALLAVLAAAGLYGLQADSVAGRLSWWRSAWEMFLARPLAGFGYAGFSWAHGGFQPGAVFREHSIYAHSYYLEFLAENGLPAALLWFWAVLAAVRRRAGFARYAAIAALAHSLVDFGLSVPANFWVFCWLLASPAPAGGTVRPERRRVLAAAAFAGLLLLAGAALGLRSLAFEKARARAYAAAVTGDLQRAEAELAPALYGGLFRGPALDLLGRLSLPAAPARAAVYYEMSLLENAYDGEAWRELRRIYSLPAFPGRAAALEARRLEVFR
jgi:O-antigen ligase